MADDLNSAIKQIAQMFGMSGGGGNSAGGSDPIQSADPPAQAYQPSSLAGLTNNMDVISKARDMLDSFNNASDHRINLLNSIHPMLSPKRQASCASCIQLLKIISVISTISPGNRSSGPKG